MSCSLSLLIAAVTSFLIFLYFSKSNSLLVLLYTRNSRSLLFISFFVSFFMNGNFFLFLCLIIGVNLCTESSYMFLIIFQDSSTSLLFSFSSQFISSRYAVIAPKSHFQYANRSRLCVCIVPKVMLYFHFRPTWSLNPSGHMYSSCTISSSSFVKI